MDAYKPKETSLQVCQPLEQKSYEEPEVLSYRKPEVNQRGSAHILLCTQVHLLWTPSVSIIGGNGDNVHGNLF